MGLLNKWTKKKEKEQLEAVETKEQDVVVEQTEKKADAPKAEKVVIPAGASDVLVKPLISEKAVMQEANGVYTFVVTNRATKIDVKKAVNESYGVMPTKVRMMNMEGKRVRFGRYRGRRSDWKKAIVTLPKGQSISIHEGV